MTAPSQSVCTPWATIADVTGPCADYDFDPALLEDGLLMASDILFGLTGKRWPGVCADVVRPCTQYRQGDSRRSGLYGSALNTVQGRQVVAATGMGTSLGAWWEGGISFCNCNRSEQCGCSRLSVVEVGTTPIVEITQVRVDGDVLDPARYRVDDWRWLVYLPDPDDPSDPGGWPCCQDLSLPPTEVGTFEVACAVGSAPPIGGLRSAASLGCELARGWAGDGSCRLPSRVLSVTRQGVTQTFASPWTIFEKGLTGLPEVDVWITSVLTGDRRRRSAVVVPETAARKVRRTDT